MEGISAIKKRKEVHVWKYGTACLEVRNGKFVPNWPIKFLYDLSELIRQT